MRALSNAQYLNLWERGAHLHPIDQGLLALSVAFPEISPQTLSNWPLGKRNRALAELRRACFGPELEGAVPCPSCNEQLELTMDTRKLAEIEHSASDAMDPIMVKGYSFRVPNSKDLAKAAAERDTRAAMACLLETCCLDTGPRDPMFEVLSEEEMEEVGERMALSDPGAETRLSLQCAACGHQWEETLDISVFLWSEFGARARRALHEVHTLASAYGWTEGEVLSLSERRRALYLEMVRA